MPLSVLITSIFFLYSCLPQTERLDKRLPVERPNKTDTTDPNTEDNSPPSTNTETPEESGDLIIEEPASKPKSSGTVKLSNQKLNLNPSHNALKNIRGVWLTHHTFEKMSDAKIKRVAKDLVRASFNTLYLTVYAGGVPKWNSNVYKEAGGRVEEDSNLAFLVNTFQEAGLRVVAWFEYGLALYPKSHRFVKQYPEWLQRDSAGSHTGNEVQVFMSPSHPDVRKLLKGMLVELVDEFEFNEIQFDRFRYTRASSEGREFGYEKVSKDKFKAQFGKDAPSDKNDPDWVKFREGEVNQLVKECYEAVKAANPNMLVSNAPVGDYGIKQHLQRWSDWLKGGYIDYLALQVYNTDLSGFKAHLDRHIQILESNGLSDRKAQIAVGLRSKELNDAQQTLDSIIYANQKGFYNTVLWAYHFYDKDTVAIKDDVLLLRKKNNKSSGELVWGEMPLHPFISKK